MAMYDRESLLNDRNIDNPTGSPRSNIREKWPEDPVTAGVLTEFLKICEIPHGSGNEQALAGALRDRLASLGFETRIDGAGNLICDIPASPGLEKAPLLAFQGHIDMVCAVREGSGWNPSEDGVTVRIDDETSSRPLICSDGRSSLGADCGMGDAAVMWLVTGGAGAEDLVHGPLRVIFTVGEEVGLIGASAISPDELRDVKYLVNVDGFSGNRIVAGSAGGRRETYTGRCISEDLVFENRSDYCAFEFSVTGFHGGHSGYDIDKHRVNAVKMIAALLKDMKDSGLDYRLAAFNGGTHHNVIPGNASAVVVFRRSDMIIAQKSMQMLMYILTSKYGETDWAGRFVFHEIALPKKALGKQCASDLVDFVHGVPDGVYAYTDIPQGEGESFVVDTSINVGKVSCSAAEGSDLKVLMFLRTMSDDFKDIIIRMNETAAKKYHFEHEYQDYTFWEFDPESELLKNACRIHRDVTGEDPVATAVHVGLELSVFRSKCSHLDMICIGSELHSPHSVHERVELDSVKPLALKLKGLAAWAADQA